MHRGSHVSSKPCALSQTDVESFLLTHVPLKHENSNHAAEIRTGQEQSWLLPRCAADWVILGHPGQDTNRLCGEVVSYAKTLATAKQREDCASILYRTILPISWCNRDTLLCSL